MSTRPNDLFLIEIVKNSTKNLEDIKVLDFGCGIGQLIQLGLDFSLDIYGVDTYKKYYEDWKNKIPKKISERISEIHNNKTKFRNNTFDFIVSNQVFEHIEKPQASFKEIYRILKPNGILYVIFPNKSVWYEGHIGLYFPHWFKKNSFLQISYLRLCYLFGLGRKRHLKVEGWRHILNDVTFYHKAKSIEKIIFESFANKPESVAGEYINFRIKKSRFKIILNYINKVFRFILVFITNKRAGSILKVIKN